MIKLENVTHWYNHGASEEIKALEQVSLEINAGEFVVVLGHNGSGKSTFSKLLNALIVPHEGSVTVDGMGTHEEQFLYRIRSLVGMVFQNPDSQLVASTVEEELAFGPENLGLEPSEIRERVDKALTLTGMERFRYSSPNRLSGGQKQRVAIASVLTMLPRYLVLDESTSMLDPQGQREILSTVLELNRRQGIAAVLITQNMHEVFYAHRVIVMNRGRLAYDGTPSELFSRPRKLVRLGLDMPALGQLKGMLYSSGIELSSGCLTAESLADEISAMLGRKKRK